MPDIRIGPKMWILGHQAADEVALLRAHWEEERLASIAHYNDTKIRKTEGDDEFAENVNVDSPRPEHEEDPDADIFSNSTIMCHFFVEVLIQSCRNWSKSQSIAGSQRILQDSAESS